MQQSSIISKLTNYLHIRATVCVRVEMPVTPYMYGECHVSMAPPNLVGPTYACESYYQRPIGAIFNANAGAPVELRYPFFSYLDRINIWSATLTQLHVTLTVAGLSPLSMADASAVGVPNLNIYCWLEDVVLLDQTCQPTLASGPVEPLGFLSSTFRFMRDRLPVFNRTDDTGVNLSTGGNRRRPLADGGEEVADPMDYVYFTRRWGLVNAVTLSTTSVPGALLTAVPVTPYLRSPGNVPIPSVIPYLASSAWQGSMEFRLTVAATPFHRGKLLVTYMPTTYNSPTAQTLSDMLSAGHACVFDISQSVDMIFRCGRTSEFPALATVYTKDADITNNNLPMIGGLPLIAQSTLLSGNLLQGTQGQFCVYVFDALLAPAAGSVTINVWARCAEDMQFTRDPGYLSSTITLAAGPELSSTGAQFSQNAWQLHDEPPLCDLGGSVVPPGTITALYGDEGRSFRNILGRYVPFLTMTPWTTPPSADIDLNVYVQVPMYPPVCRATPTTTLYASRSPNAGYCYMPPTFFGLYQGCFAYITGGMKHRMTSNAHWSNALSGHVSTYMSDIDIPFTNVDPWTFYTATNLTNAADVQTSTQAMSVAARGFDLQRFQPGASGAMPVDVVIPHRAAYNWIRPWINSVSQMNLFGYLMSWEVDTSSITPNFRFWAACGDDFHVAQFLGVPVINTTVTLPYAGVSATA